MTEEETPRRVMLPAFEPLRQEFARTIQRLLRERVRSNALLREINRSVVHEGAQSQIRRAGENEYDSIEMKETSGSMEISFEEIERIDLKLVLEKIDIAANEFIRQHLEHLFQTLEDATRKSGNVVDAKGKPLGHDEMFQALEKMQIDFNGDYNFSELIMVVPPSMASRIEQLDLELRNSPDLKVKFEKLRARKIDEFRAREMDRNLAG